MQQVDNMPASFIAILTLLNHVHTAICSYAWDDRICFVRLLYVPMLTSFTACALYCHPLVVYT